MTECPTCGAFRIADAPYVWRFQRSPTAVRMSGEGGLPQTTEALLLWLRHELAFPDVDAIVRGATTTASSSSPIDWWVEAALCDDGFVRICIGTAGQPEPDTLLRLPTQQWLRWTQHYFVDKTNSHLKGMLP